MARSVLVALLGLAGTLGCAPERTLDESVTEPIRIGVVLDMQGGLAQSFLNRRDSIALAVREVNSAGGLLGARPVELLIAGADGTVNDAVGAAMRLVDEGAVALVEGTGSAGSLAMYERVSNTIGILQATGSSTTPEFTELQRARVAARNDLWFFRTAPSDAGQAPILAGQMEGDCTRAAIVHLDDAYGIPLANGVSDSFIAAGSGRDAALFSIVAGRDQYDAEVRAVGDYAPDCITMIAYPTEAGRFINQYTTLYLNDGQSTMRWFGADGLHQQAFLAQVGALPVIAGMLGTAPVTDTAGLPYNQFSTRYRATYARDPSAFDANFYDATAIILLAIEAAGSTDRDQIRDKIRQVSGSDGSVVQAGQLADALERLRDGESINYDGASGSVNVDEYGDVTGPFEVWRVNVSTDASMRDTASFVRVTTVAPR